MVTERSTGSDAIDIRRSYEEYIDAFGTTVTIRNRTETTDSMGRNTSTVTATSTIKADIQWVSKKDLDHSNLGDVKVGDGMLFTLWNGTVNLEDEVEFDGIRYRIVEQIEGEQIKGGVVYRGWIIRKNEQ